MQLVIPDLVSEQSERRVSGIHAAIATGSDPVQELACRAATSS